VEASSATPQLIEVKKYPNRRLYDSTRSQHLTHEELYQLVLAGHTVRVTESRTGADITSLVLMQALIEHNPEKFAAFPPELVHLLIRASEQMLHGFASNWFAQVMSAMPGFAGAGFTGAGHQPASRATAAPSMAPWMTNPVFPWSIMAPPQPATPEPRGGAEPEQSKPRSRAPNADVPSDAVNDLESRLLAMMDELERLKRGRSA
jgi:polyhydroxyalkanoate synthesis repressor PhaR